MLKDSFCFVGIGQGGCKLTKLFHSEKYRSFFINTSYDDLSQLNVSDDLIYHVPASKGCAKVREVALEYGRNYYGQMTGKLIDTHPTVKVYVVQYTLGGGTGGGLANLFMATLRNKLKELNKKDVIIIAVCAKPRSFESYQLQSNAEKSLNELYALVKGGIVNQYYIIDNDSRDNLNDINEEHCVLFDRWIEGEGANNDSNTDESERMDLFKYNGSAMMFEFDASNKDDFKERCKKAYEESIYCHPLKKVKGIGVALHEKILEKDALPLISEVVGYFPNTHTTPTKVSNMIMIAGSDENKTIKNSIIKLANAQAELINGEIDDPEEEEITIASVNIGKPNDSKTEEAMASIDDILNYFK